MEYTALTDNAKLFASQNRLFDMVTRSVQLARPLVHMPHDIAGETFIRLLVSGENSCGRSKFSRMHFENYLQRK